MALHVFVFLFVCCLLISLALLWRLDWFPLRPSSSRGRAKRSTLHRSLCSTRHTIVPPVDSASLFRRLECQLQRMSRPWCKVKRRWGSTKQVNTEDFVSPKQALWPDIDPCIELLPVLKLASPQNMAHMVIHSWRHIPSGGTFKP